MHFKTISKHMWTVAIHYFPPIFISYIHVLFHFSSHPFSISLFTSGVRLVSAQSSCLDCSDVTKVKCSSSALVCSFPTRHHSANQFSLCCNQTLPWRRWRFRGETLKRGGWVEQTCVRSPWLKYCDIFTRRFVQPFNILPPWWELKANGRRNL